MIWPQTSPLSGSHTPVKTLHKVSSGPASSGGLGLELGLALGVALQVGHGRQQQQDDAARADQGHEVRVPAVRLHYLRQRHARIRRACARRSQRLYAELPGRFKTKLRKIHLTCTFSCYASAALTSRFPTCPPPAHTQYMHVRSVADFSARCTTGCEVAGGRGDYFLKEKISPCCATKGPQ